MADLQKPRRGARRRWSWSRISGLRIISVALVLEQEGRHGEAIRELERAVELSAGNLLTIGSLGHAYAHAGRPSEAHRVLDQLRSREASGAYVPPFAIALIRAGLLDKDAAFEMLENAYRERSPLLGIWLTTEPRLEILRSDPRFSELIARTGFLAGWKAPIPSADACQQPS
jgi:hypothetical protein